MFMPFEKWSPDLPEWRNPGAIVAKGVVARNGFYAPIKKPVVLTDPLADVANGCVAAKRALDGTVFNYAATRSKLYEMTSALGWSERTRLVGGDYTTTDPDRWEFAQFGETLIGVNGWADDPQSISLGDANFDALAGSPPRARHIAVVQSFVVFGNTFDTIDGTRTSRLWWSPFNNAAGPYVPSLATQCSFRDLVGSGGAIQRIIGGEYGVVLRERSLARMSYIGPPGVFQLDEIEDSHGCIAPWSAVKYGRLTFYLSDDGWYVFDGAQSAPIGRDIIDDTFKTDFQSSYAGNVIGSVDPVTKLIHFIYPGAGASGGVPNRDLILNPANMQFTTVDFNNEYVTPVYSSVPVTTDNVDAIYANTDALDGFTDDSAYAGGGLQLGFFNDSHELTLLSGGNQPAQIDTGERQLNPTGRAFVEGLRPMLDAASGVTVTALERDTPYQTSVTTGESDTLDDIGEAHPRSDARLHRFRVEIAEDTEWRKAEGIYVTEVESAGVN
jgi:hypothetical protein